MSPSPTDREPLRTDRLVLAPLTPGHAEAQWRWLQDPAMFEHMAAEPVGGPAEIAAHTADHVQHERRAVLLGGELIGSVSLCRPAGRAAADLGFWLAPPHQGRGYMAEAVAAMLRHGFETLGYHRIEGQHFDGNEPSGVSMKLAGMTCEGTQRQSCYCKGRWRDVTTYAALTDEWPPAEVLVPILETDRLILRPPRVQDAAAMFVVARVPAFSENLTWSPHANERETRRVLRSMRVSGEVWTITRRDGGDEWIGNIGLSRKPDPRSHVGEFGFQLAPPHQGLGLMPEAIRAVVMHAFKTTDLLRVQAYHAHDNPASGRAMSKAGMTREGTQRQAVRLTGRVRDAVMYGLTRDDFEASTR